MAQASQLDAQAAHVSVAVTYPCPALQPLGLHFALTVQVAQFEAQAVQTLLLAPSKKDPV